MYFYIITFLLKKPCLCFASSRLWLLFAALIGWRWWANGWGAWSCEYRWRGHHTLVQSHFKSCFILIFMLTLLFYGRPPKMYWMNWCIILTYWDFLHRMLNCLETCGQRWLEIVYCITFFNNQFSDYDVAMSFVVCYLHQWAIKISSHVYSNGKEIVVVDN